MCFADKALRCMSASELCLKPLLQEKSMDCSNLVAQCVEIVNLIDSKCVAPKHLKHLRHQPPNTFF